MSVELKILFRKFHTKDKGANQIPCVRSLLVTFVKSLLLSHSIHFKKLVQITVCHKIDFIKCKLKKKVLICQWDYLRDGIL